MHNIDIIQKPVRENFLPFALPSIGPDEIAEVIDSLKSGWITTGPKTKRFEEEAAEYIKARHAIAVNSCTAGLLIALTAFGVEAGDEVIIPTLTFCSTANVVVHLGARPVLVDVEADFNVSAQTIEAAITSRTKAIMPVHFGGQACDLQQIYEVAARHNLAVVEDAAHAIGTVYHQHLIGSDQLQTGYPGLRRATVFSFYATKNMTTAEGGLITTNDDALAETMRLLTLHGMSRDAWKRYTSAGSWYYEVVLPGYKANMTDIQAAMGLHQLRRLPDFIETRQQYAAIYDRAFATMSEVEIPLTHSERNHVYHLYALRLNLEQLTIDRAQFIEGLKACGIGTSVHFIPVHLHPLYQRRFNYRQGDLPQAEAIYEQIVSLPLYPSLTVEDINDVVQAVIYVIGTNRRSYHETNLH